MSKYDIKNKEGLPCKKMKKFVLFLILLGMLTGALGQTYKVGDLYTAPDGSQGIVFYIFSDGTGGWAVALHDASSGCLWGTSEDIPNLSNYNPSYYQQLLNDTAGYTNTQVIRIHQNNSTQYAAGVIDFAHGWYLPSSSQLSMLFSRLPIISSGLISAGGSALAYDCYWCSTEYSESEAWRVDFGVNNYSGFFSYTSKNSSNRVRAVRSFSIVSMNYDSTLTYLWNTGSEQPFISITPEQTTNYSVTATSVYGCSSSADQTIVVGTGTPVTITDQICQGTCYDANGFIVSREETSSTGILTRTRITETNGCEDSLTLKLTVLPKDSIDIYQNACESFTWNGITYYESGHYLQYYSNQHGCDSIIALHLTINPKHHETQTRTICFSDLPYNWDGTSFVNADTKIDTLTTSNGCDSIITKTLTIFPTNIVNVFKSICQNELPYSWNGIIFTEADSKLDTLLSVNGCDSIIRMVLTVNPTPALTILSLADTICKGDSITLYADIIDMIPDNEYAYLWNTGGSVDSIITMPSNSINYSLTATSPTGCRTTTEKTITVLPLDTVIIAQNACDSFKLNNITYKESGIYIQRLTNSAGCDSIVKLNLSVSNAPTTTISASNDSICIGNSVTLQIVSNDTSMLLPSVSIGDILCSDGSIVQSSDWPSSGKTALGVVFYVDSTGEHGWAVHLHDQGNNIRWSTSSSDLAALTNYSTGRYASYDLDGFTNTQTIRSTGEASTYPAAWLVDFSNGWYLPAAGQLNFLYISIFSINNSLVEVGGTPIPTNIPFSYWSSTEQSQSTAWYISSLGALGINPKNSVFSIRSIRSF